MRPLLTAALALALVGEARAAPCGPAAELLGPPELVQAVSEGLLARGMRAPAPGCPATRVRLGRHGRQIVVAELGEGAPRERLVADAETAASLIESFTRSDISAPLLGGRTIIVDHPPAPAPAAAPARASSVVVAAAVEAAVGFDASLWIGASLRGCGRLGPVCLGVLLRAAGDVAPPALAGYAVERLAADFLASLSVPLRRRRLLLSPSVGVGGGLLWTQITGDILAGSKAGGGFRAELGLGLGVLLARELSLDLALSLAAALPPGGGDLLATPYVDVRMGRGRDDPMTIAAPGGPYGLLRLGVGLRWGGT